MALPAEIQEFSAAEIRAAESYGMLGLVPDSVNAIVRNRGDAKAAAQKIQRPHDIVRAHASCANLMRGAPARARERRNETENYCGLRRLNPARLSPARRSLLA